jgi:uncharacterized peroxidase-related enzyme
MTSRVPVVAGVPGIRALMMFRPETGKPLMALAEQLLRGPSSLTSGERELIAATVSTANECRFCASSHAAAAAAHLGDAAFVSAVCADPAHAPGLSEKMRALLAVALLVKESGRAVSDAAVAAARAAGADDVAVHDTVLVAAAFCMFNRYVDGLAAPTPTDPAVYAPMGQMLKEQGYVR